jgi:hypothetical protein
MYRLIDWSIRFDSIRWMTKQARKDNQALALYINTKRKNEEVWKKEEAQKKMEEEASKVK